MKECKIDKDKAYYVGKYHSNKNMLFVFKHKIEKTINEIDYIFNNYKEDGDKEDGDRVGEDSERDKGAQKEQYKVEFLSVLLINLILFIS